MELLGGLVMMIGVIFGLLTLMASCTTDDKEKKEYSLPNVPIAFFICWSCVIGGCLAGAWIGGI